MRVHRVQGRGEGLPADSWPDRVPTVGAGLSRVQRPMRLLRTPMAGCRMLGRALLRRLEAAPATCAFLAPVHLLRAAPEDPLTPAHLLPHTALLQPTCTSDGVLLMVQLVCVCVCEVRTERRPTAAWKSGAADATCLVLLACRPPSGDWSGCPTRRQPFLNLHVHRHLPNESSHHIYPALVAAWVRTCLKQKVLHHQAVRIPGMRGERCERRERLVRLARMDSLLSSCFDVHSGAQSSPHLANWPLQAVTLGLRPRCHQHDILLTAINVEHLPVQLYMVSPHTATYQHGSRSRSSRPFEIHRCMRQGSSETFVSKSVKHRVANGPASRAFSFVGTPFVERRFSLRGGVMAGGAS